MMGRVQQMQEQIHEIHMARDPARREELLIEHMQSMLDMIGVMGRLSGTMPMGNDKPGSPSDVIPRQQMMERQIVAMQMLMQQMLQHEQAAQAALPKRN